MECCQEKSNIYTVREKKDGNIMVYQKCSVCNRRHFTMDAEPGKLGVTLSAVGG